MKAYRLTNNARGARGHGFDILVDPGQSIEVKLSDDDATLIELEGLLQIEPVEAKSAPKSDAKK